MGAMAKSSIRSTSIFAHWVSSLAYRPLPCAMASSSVSLGIFKYNEE
jgi:hypothetical protein